MNPFDQYPNGGCKPLGRPRNWDNCRHGYGLEVQWITGQTTCAYCGVSLTDNYHHWLLMSVDHVIPQGEANRLGIDPTYASDFINLVVCCSGCNGFDNRYEVAAAAQQAWTIEEFVDLRDEVFADKAQRIARRRSAKLDFFDSKPWENRQWESIRPG